MLRLFLMIAAVALSVVSAEARVSWFGRAVIIAAPGAACADDGIAVGQNFETAFFPSGITDNGPETYLTFYSQNTVSSIRVTGRPAAGKTYESIRINSYGKYGQNSPGQVAAFTAPAFTDATTFINMTIRLTNWEGTTGCTTTLTISSVRRRP